MNSKTPGAHNLEIAGMLDQALLHHRAGRLTQAESIYKQVLSVAPGHADALHLLGVIARQAGNNDGAVKLIGQAIRASPANPTYYNNLGNALKDLGRLEEALDSYRKALLCKPDYAESHANAGTVLRMQHKLDEAVESYRKALSFMPDLAAVHNNLGNALRDQGKLDEAVESYRNALGLEPGFALAQTSLGNALRDQGKLDEAVASYRKALSLKPDWVEVHNNLGLTFRDQGKLDDAAASLRAALSIRPDLPEVHNNLGLTLRDQFRLDDAVASFREAIALKPQFDEAYNNLGHALRDQHKLDEAVENFRKALAFKPDFAMAHYNLGNVLHDQGNADEAIERYRRALACKPDFAEAHFNLGIILMDQGKLSEAEACHRRALELKPDWADAHNNLGRALQHLGRLPDAEASYRRALELRPEFAEAYDNLLFLQGETLRDPREYLSLARGWEQTCVPAQDRQAARRRRFRRMPLAGRRLRVGYVSGDFRQHAVSFFVEQLFRHHDRARIELFAYPTHGLRDAVTERLRASADHWGPLIGMSDSAIRDRIEADGIDVLIDLSGHTAHNCLGVFARRAAPVQAHYLGFFASTGLTEMDYWIGDEILTPPRSDRHFSERIWRLPRVWVSYEGKADAPLPDRRPAQDGAVWVGSFNSLHKLTPATLSLWARVLHALPEGRLLIKAKQLADVGNRRRILEALANHGISSNRVDLQDWSVTPGWPAHMAYYNRMDIALDPVGTVGGGTTTCDALWMAVPVITLVGDRMASRMTASMLNALGHPEWIAQSESEYIDKVVALARNVDHRTELRLTLRNQMARSPLCNARELAMNLENAYVDMFQRWLDAK